MAWLYVPVAQDSNSGSSSPSATPIAPSVMLNGTPMPPPSWQRAWKKGGWIQRLSGTMSPPSTADAGVAQWISSLRASRANPSARPAHNRATGTSATSGRRSAGLSTGRDRLSCFWKTSQECLPFDSAMADQPTQLSEANWSAWVTKLRKHSSVRRMSEPHIDASDSLSWATPQAHDGTGGTASGGPTGDSRQKDLPREALSWMTTLWPTPTSSVDSGSAKYSIESGRHAGTTLTDAVQLWPTPAARDVKGANSPESQRTRAFAKTANGQQLPNYIAHFWCPPDQTMRVAGPPPSPSGPISPQRLNPAFVEWLMGWPEGWSSAHSDSASSAMASTRWQQQWHSAYLRCPF